MSTVLKATAPKDPPNFDALSAQMEQAILRAVKKVRSGSSREAVLLALEAGDIEGALDALRMDLGEAELAASIPRTLRQALEDAALQERDTLDRVLSAELRARFDIVNPSAIEYVRTRGAELIEEFGASSMEALRELIRRALAEGITPVRLVGMIIDSGIGLTGRQVVAMANYRRGLEEAGLSPERIDRMVERWAARALRYRARLIARTEIIRASREGSQELWGQAVDQGLIDPNKAMQQWLTAEDELTCPECSALDKVMVPLGGTFPGGLAGPPAHPACRCAITLLPYGGK